MFFGYSFSLMGILFVIYHLVLTGCPLKKLIHVKYIDDMLNIYLQSKIYLCKEMSVQQSKGSSPLPHTKILFSFWQKQIQA